MMGLLENYVDFFGFYSNDDDDFVLFSDEDEVQSLCAAALHDGIASDVIDMKFYRFD